MKKILVGFLVLFCNLNANEIYANFNVVASKSAELALTSGGIISNIYSDVSSVVKKAEKLAVLKNSDLKASLRIAKANFDNAKISLNFAKKDYARQVQIKDLVDQEKFDQYTLTLEKTEVALRQAEANVAYQEALLDKTILYAPFDGVIFEKSVEVGDAVSGVSPKTIFKIQSLHDRKLILEFDQKYWKDVKIGDSYNYTIDGDSTQYIGVISKIYPYANSGNRKIKAEVQVKDFIVGLFGNGSIISTHNK